MDVLRYVMVKIGLRAQNWPSPEETGLLIHHIMTNYGGHTAAEIQLAFDMAVTGKLECEVNCFENFSCLYFSGIMNAYRKWASQQAAYEQNKHQPIPELPAAKPDDRHLVETGRMVYEFYKKLYPEGEVKRWIYIPQDTFYALERLGEITLSAEEKIPFLTRATGVIERILTYDYGYCAPEEKPNLAKAYARKMVCYDYFDGKLTANIAKPTETA